MKQEIYLLQWDLLKKLLSARQRATLKYQRGVSLIEVIVVTAILMLISIAVFRTFNRQSDKARDAQRKDDLSSLKTAMANYYNDHDTYPPVEYFSLENCNSSVLSPYLREFPCDPLTGQPYLYLPSPSDEDRTLGYRILSKLANMTDPIIEQLGCTGGCIEDNEAYAEYVYGISEGVTLGHGASARRTILGVEDCEQKGMECYCCESSGNQACQPFINRNISGCASGRGQLYATRDECIQNSSCS